MNTNKPKVSVLVLTYNHENYISQCLDGILLQKTPFEFETLIYDDCSTDNTQKILREYESKYPGKFDIIYSDTNLYSKHISSVKTILMKKAKGDYFAFVEGDDYWTDENKLAMQAEILDNNKSFSACVHNAVVVDENCQVLPDNFQSMFREENDRIKDITYIDDVSHFGHFATNMFRASIFDMPEEQRKDFDKLRTNGDMLFAAIAAVNGNVYHIAKDMSCYRCTFTGTSWTARTKNLNMSLVTHNMLCTIQNFILKYYKVKIPYKKYFETLSFMSIHTLLKSPSKDNFTIMRKVTKSVRFPFVKFIGRELKNIISKLH